VPKSALGLKNFWNIEIKESVQRLIYPAQGQFGGSAPNPNTVFLAYFRWLIRGMICFYSSGLLIRVGAQGR